MQNKVILKLPINDLNKCIKMLNQFINYIRNYNPRRLYRTLETNMHLQAKVLINQFKTNINRDYISLHEFEFKVYSQWGDDGIIQFIINRINIENKSFVEFGVEDYKESNTRFLLINNNWKGLVMDGSEKNVSRIRQDDIYWKYDITAKQAFITAENINDLLNSADLDLNNLGLLHIDVDGMDYWIWKSISLKPVIVIVEYNALFGNKRPIVVPYQKDFIRNKAHHSNLYFGSSLKALALLASEKGYTFIGCNSSGNNAYFIRNDYSGSFKKMDPDTDFTESKFSEYRTEKGKLEPRRRKDLRRVIDGLKVFNVETGKIELL